MRLNEEINKFSTILLTVFSSISNPLMENEKSDNAELVSRLEIFLIDVQVSRGPTSRRDATGSESVALRHFSN